MSEPINKILVVAGCLFCLILFAECAKGQEIMFNYNYLFEPVMATDRPQIGGLDVDYPEAARKNGVEGTLKATLTLGEDGRVRDITILEGLPFGVNEAVMAALKKWYFKPAMNSGTPVAAKMTLYYVVSVVYDESDKNVSKAKVTEKPAATYPSKYTAEKLKGKVDVIVVAYADGKLKVLGANSVLPREFDKAAMEAAAGIKFQPATHKKSKKAVSQQISVEYNFKP